MVRKWVPALVASMLALAACGGGDDDSGSAGGTTGADGELRQVTVGMLPILPTAALYAGIEEGFFEDNGIEITVETGQGGAALLPAVVSGDIEFATSNPVSLLQARDKDLDVRVIGHWTSALSEGDTDINGVVAEETESVWVLDLTYWGIGEDPGELTYQGSLVPADEAEAQFGVKVAPEPTWQNTGAGYFFIFGVPETSVADSQALRLMLG